MNNLVPMDCELINGDTAPQPKPSRKKNRKAAQQAVQDLQLVTWTPDKIDQIATLGQYFDDAGAAKAGRGIFVISLDGAQQHLADVNERIKAMGEAPEDPELRIAHESRLEFLIKERGMAIRLLKDIGSDLVRSKPDSTITIKEERKTVQSFPANTPIPAIDVTQTKIVEESG